jgi:hypothetical protein
LLGQAHAGDHVRWRDLKLALEFRNSFVAMQLR